MDATTIKIAMAGYFHDIGKFADADTMGVPAGYFDRNAQIYLPSWKGEFSHYHALYTAAFIEQMAEFLPPELNIRQWGEGDSFINLAACHHKPESPLQQIIAVADRLASGLERDEYEPGEGHETPYKDYKKTRMVPLFEQLAKEEEISSPDEFRYGYRLLALSPTSIFPVKKEDLGSGNEKQEYRQLFDSFRQDLPALLDKDNIVLWFEHFDTLMMLYTSHIPSARAGLVIPDVSLYDHSRLTSAFATALYLYHKEHGLETEAIKESEQNKFLLVSGNFFGIQNFIFSGYGDTRRYRSKLLRGRSFYVSLLSELAADYLCKTCGLPFTSILLNAAGRFTVLAPNSDAVRKSVQDVVGQINAWLVQIGFGEISFGISTTQASPSEFFSKRFSELWDRLSEDMERCKYQKIDLERFGGPVTGYLEGFGRLQGQPLCPLCGRRPRSEATRDWAGAKDVGMVCELCRDHVYIGTNLVKNPVVVVWDKKEIKGRNRLARSVFERYQLSFFPATDVPELRSGGKVKCWDISQPGEGGAFLGITKKFINSYVPVYEQEDLAEFASQDAKQKGSGREDSETVELGQPITFSHIAKKALRKEKDKRVGLEALGVLKADIDHLGRLMACGLSERRHTISRVATVSRQIDYFFALYIPYLLASKDNGEFRKIYTVFAGGDDLFLIGPWNKVYGLALKVQSEFCRYVCGNEAITLSAGLTIHKAHEPMSSLAQKAKRALEMSKHGGRNSFTMFSQTATWTEAGELEEVRKKLEEWLTGEQINNAMLYRLNTFIGMAERAEQLKKMDEIPLRAMRDLKWRSLFYYSAKRNLAKKEPEEKREEVIEQMVHEIAEWLVKYGGKLRIPLWNILYNNRRCSNAGIVEG